MGLKHLILLVPVFLVTAGANAQNREREHRNSVYLTPGLVYSLTASYERVWKATDRKRRSIRGTYGKYSEPFFGDVGDVISLSHISLIRWKRNQHLEWGLGALALTSKDRDGSIVFDFYPAGNAGYRLLTGRGLILRAGVGFPEAVYGSIGLAF